MIKSRWVRVRGLEYGVRGDRQPQQPVGYKPRRWFGVQASDNTVFPTPYTLTSNPYC